MPNFRKFKPGNGKEGGKIVSIPKKRAGTDIVATPDDSEAGADVVATPEDWDGGVDQIKPQERKKLRKRHAGSPKVIRIKEEPPEES